jgi:hypothetical protein
VLFLVSKAWLGSRWCLKEFNLAHRLNKRLFGVLIEDLSVGELPEELAGTWQIVRLATGRDHVMLRVVLPVTHDEMHVTFSMEGLQRLKHGLEEAGLEAKYFAWPPQNDPNRGCGPLKLRMPAFSSAVTLRSWRYSIGCAGCGRPYRRDSLSFLVHPVQASLRSCVPDSFHGSCATTEIFYRCRSSGQNGKRSRAKAVCFLRSKRV